MKTEKSLHYYYQHIDCSKITNARELRALTRKKLADLLDKKPSAVTQFESGRSGLAFETFVRLVQVLDVHPAYLTSTIDKLPELKIESCHFRANRSVSQTQRTQAKRYAENVLSVYSFLEKKGISFQPVVLPTYEGHELSEHQIENFAIDIRKSFGLDLGPIHNMAELLESLGVFIILLPGEYSQLDAFATWFEDRPCIMITKNSPASRMQFDYGHELAHLLLDEGKVPGDLFTERLANRFSSAFLMPKSTFSGDCPRHFSLSQFLSVKEFWHVSIGAALYRARQLGIMTERSYKSATINMSQKGLRQNEPGEFAPPLPTMLEQALELVANDTSIEDIANSLGKFQWQIISLLQEQGISGELINRMTPAPRKATVLQLQRQNEGT